MTEQQLTLSHFTRSQGMIRRRLMNWGLALLGVALVLNTSAGLIYTRSQIKEASAELQLEMASATARHIHSFITRKVERLQDAATAMTLYPLGGAEQRLLGQLLLKNDGAFSELSLLDEKGIELFKFSERKVYLPSDLEDQSSSQWFTKAIRGDIYLGPVHTSDQAEPFITLAVPLKEGPQRSIGVLIVQTNLKFLWEVIGGSTFGDGGYAYLVNRNGVVIAHKDASLVLKQISLRNLSKVQQFLRDPSRDPAPGEQSQGITGKPVLSTFAPVSDLGWAVILEEPVELALSDITTLQRYAVLLLVVGLLIGAAIIVWVSNKITKPILQLRRGVETIRSGNLDHRVDVTTGDEIEELAEEFNKMTEALRSSYATLEQKVTQRTLEVSALYEVTTTVNQSLDLESVLQAVIQKITQIFQFDTTRVYLFDPGMEVLHLRAYFETHYEDWGRVETIKRGESIVGRVADSGKPLLFEDVQSDPRYIEWSANKTSYRVGMHSFYVFPIKTKSRIFGAMGFSSKERRKLGDEELRLLNSMSEHVGLAVEKASLFEQVKERSEHLAVLNTIGAAVSQSLDLDVVLKAAIEKVVETLRFDASWIYLLDPSGTELHLKASRGLRDENTQAMATRTASAGIGGKVVETGERLVFEDVQDDERYRSLTGGRKVGSLGFTAAGGFPIKAKEKIIGVLHIANRAKRHFTPDELQLIESVAQEIGVAVENASLFAEVKEKTSELLKRNEEVSALYEVTTTVNQSLDLDSVLQAVIQKITQIFHFDTTRVHLFDPGMQVLNLRAYYETNSQTGVRIESIGLESIVGKVAVSGEPLLFEDVQIDLRYREWSLSKNSYNEGLHFFAVFPIKTKSRIFGTIFFKGKERRKLRDEEIRLLNSMSEHVAVAVEKASLFEQVKARSEHLAVLNTIGAAVSQSLELDVILKAAIETIVETLRFDASWIYLLDPPGTELHLKAYKGLSDETAQSMARRNATTGVVGRVLESGERLVFEDVQTDERYRSLTAGRRVRALGFVAAAGFPIRTKERIIGVLHVANRSKHPFAAEELQLIESLIQEIGVAVENARLFAQVKEKTSELLKMNEELQEATRVKSEFIAAMSHELRTPLNIIIGNADLTRDEFFGELSSDQKEALQKISRYARILLKMINDVLTLTRLEAKKMSLDVSTVEIQEVIAQAQTHVEQMNRDNHLEVRWDVEENVPPLLTDPMKLEEILQNLLGNAFKFTPTGSIEVRVRNLLEQDRIEFRVADTGVGIEAAHLEKIFNEFEQVKEAHTGNQSGVGLGLSIVKKYLELMQGDIRVESEPGLGSTFTFSLPRSVSMDS